MRGSRWGMHVPPSWLVLLIVGAAGGLQPSVAQIKFRIAVLVQRRRYGVWLPSGPVYSSNRYLRN